MGEQAPLFSVVRARNHLDGRGRFVRVPETSFEAARRIRPEALKVGERRVVNFLRMHGPSSHEQIVDGIRRIFGGHLSQSGIRSRVRECVQKGLVEAVPEEYGTTRHGHRCRLWRLTDGT